MIIIPRYQKRYENLDYEQKAKMYKENRELHDALKEDYIRRKQEGTYMKGGIYHGKS